MDELIAAHPDEWGRYVGGEAKLAGFFTGLAMAATDKKANGKAIAAELQRRRG
jgi:aspartyl-tRNA(Asn)/glutamyl-tRNA(Gln) amidotransferase subunit B